MKKISSKGVTANNGKTAGKSGIKSPLPAKSEQTRDHPTVVKALQTLNVHYK